MALESYRKKRDFQKTPEPGADAEPSRPSRPGKPRAPCFVVQEHHARRLHYDLRLEIGGVLKSWAVPKGPSMNPADKRLADQTEDHPLKYLHFEGHIPAGNYGAGDMVVWDTGTFETPEGDPEAGLNTGKLSIVLHGRRLCGRFSLVRLRDENQWLLLKSRDEDADSSWKLTPALSGEGSAARRQLVRALATNPAPQAKGRMKNSARSTAARIQGSRTAMPTSIKPMLATVATHLPTHGEWLYEIKWDGYRAIGSCSSGSATLVSRNQIDLSLKFPEIQSELALLPVKSALLDGEIVVLDADGKPDFQLLQNRAGLYSKSRQRGRSSRRSQPLLDTAATLATDSDPVFYAFDLLYLDGYDLRELPLLERKQKLATLLGDKAVTERGRVRYSDHVLGSGSGAQLLEQARILGLEGIIAKRANSLYRERRSDLWQKIKLVQTLDVVIGGYTAPRRSRSHFGALVIGLYDGNELRYVGHTGSGFNRASLEETFDLMQPLVTRRCPFTPVPLTNEPAIWIKPRLVCEVKFAEWTQDGNLRHPIFLGLRHDKSPMECRMEGGPTGQEGALIEDDSNAAVRNRAIRRAKVFNAEDAFSRTDLHGNLSVDVEGVTVELSNLDKIYWPEAGYTKGDLLRYYFQVADVLLPYLRQRPLILERFPNGISGQSFHQHNVEIVPEFLETFVHSEAGQAVRYALCNNLASLLYLANLGTIAQHPWHSRVIHVDQPDWVVFDLDPGEIEYSAVCALALEVKKTVEELGLKCYAKTSGSSGLHVYVPLAARYNYEQIEIFAALVAATTRDRRPDIATLQRSLSRRPKNSIYLDHMQNREGKTVVAPYSPRAKPGGTVSTPLTWAEVKRIPEPQSFTIASVPQRVRRRGDLFKAVLDDPQRLEILL